MLCVLHHIGVLRCAICETCLPLPTQPVGRIWSAPPTCGLSDTQVCCCAAGTPALCCAHCCKHVTACMHVCPLRAAAQTGSLTAASCDWWSTWLYGGACGAGCCEGVQHTCGTHSSPDGRRGVHLQRHINAQLCVVLCLPCGAAACAAPASCCGRPTASGTVQGRRCGPTSWYEHGWRPAACGPRPLTHRGVRAVTGQTCVAGYSRSLFIRFGQTCSCFFGPWHLGWHG